MAFISQIVYPSDLTSNDRLSYLIGWNLEGFRCCIVGAVPCDDVSFEQLQFYLANVSEELTSMCISCSSDGGSRPCVIGLWVPFDSRSDERQRHTQIHDRFKMLTGREQEHLNIWVTLTVASASNISHTSYVANCCLPQLISLHSLGSSYDTTCYWVRYTPKRSHKFECFMYNVDYLSYHSFQKYKTHRLQDNSLQRPLKRTASIAAATIVAEKEPVIPGLQYLIAQLNCVVEIRRCIAFKMSQFTSPRTLIGRRSAHRALSIIFCRVPITILRGSWDLLLWILVIAAYVWLALVRFCRVLLHGQWSLAIFSIGLSTILWQCMPIRLRGRLSRLAVVPPLSSATSISSITGRATYLSGAYSLSSGTFTAQYLSQRCYLWERAMRACILFAQAESESVSDRRLLWSETCYCLLSVAFDTTLGCLVGYYLRVNHARILKGLAIAGIYIERDILLVMLQWFRHNPGGIKLSPLITRRVGGALKFLLINAGKFISWLAVRNVFGFLLWTTSILGCVGMSSQAAFLLDLVTLFSLHLSLIQRLCALQHYSQLQLVRALWFLFQGRKQNVLRRRVDTCYFDRSQLLLGTGLFAIAALLLPSFAVYYYFFTLVMLAMLGVKILLWGICIFVSDFPLYAILLYALTGDRSTLNVGVQLRVESSVAIERNQLTLPVNIDNNHIAYKHRHKHNYFGNNSLQIPSLTRNKLTYPNPNAGITASQQRLKLSFPHREHRRSRSLSQPFQYANSSLSLTELESVIEGDECSEPDELLTVDSGNVLWKSQIQYSDNCDQQSSHLKTRSSSDPPPKIQSSLAHSQTISMETRSHTRLLDTSSGIDDINLHSTAKIQNRSKCLTPQQTTSTSKMIHGHRINSSSTHGKRSFSVSRLLSHTHSLRANRSTFYQKSSTDELGTTPTYSSNIITNSSAPSNPTIVICDVYSSPFAELVKAYKHNWEYFFRGGAWSSHIRALMIGASANILLLQAADDLSFRRRAVLLPLPTLPTAIQRIVSANEASAKSDQEKAALWQQERLGLERAHYWMCLKSLWSRQRLSATNDPTPSIPDWPHMRSHRWRSRLLFAITLLLMSVALCLLVAGCLSIIQFAAPTLKLFQPLIRRDGNPRIISWHASTSNGNRSKSRKSQSADEPVSIWAGVGLSVRIPSFWSPDRRNSNTNNTPVTVPPLNVGRRHLLGTTHSGT